MIVYGAEYPYLYGCLVFAFMGIATKFSGQAHQRILGIRRQGKDFSTRKTLRETHDDNEERRTGGINDPAYPFLVEAVCSTGES